MPPILAQSGCPDESPACRWLLDQGAPQWLAEVLGSLVGPVVRAVVILVVTAVVAAVARRLVQRLARNVRDSRTSSKLSEIGTRRVDPRRARRIDSLAQVASSIVVAVVWTIGLIMALGAFDVSLGPVLASAGIVGVALGFGAQSLVEDFLSGMFMLAEDQFGVGDVIDVGEATGVVEEITLRTTSLRAVDGTLWFVPNGEIKRVGNMSQDWARALLDVSVAYDADVDHAMAVIAATSRDFAADDAYSERVLDEPEILGVEDLGADAVVIRLWIKTVPGEQWDLTRELRRRLKLALDEAEIAIPFPQRTVWLRSDADVDEAAHLVAAAGRSRPADDD